jgi:superfamily II DNA helicase RecQ
VVEEGIIKLLQLQNPLLIKGGFNRPNLQYTVRQCHQGLFNGVRCRVVCCPASVFTCICSSHSNDATVSRKQQRMACACPQYQQRNWCWLRHVKLDGLPCLTPGWF